VYVRRRPTLPRPRDRSTIGAERLNFRVRDGTGCFPLAMAAVTLATHPHPACTRVCVEGWVAKLKWFVCSWTRTCVLFPCALQVSLTTARKHRCLCCLLSGCGTSPRPISTGRLGITAVHLRPINPVFCWGPYPVDPVGNLILKRASRLDAFSGYHFRT
jgi:hypothetical protein